MPEAWQQCNPASQDQKAQQLNTHFDKFAPDHLSSRQQLCYTTTPASRNFLPWRGKSMRKYTALTYYSSGHSINKTTWKDAECRIPLKLISASPSATLSCPRFLAEEARSNVATYFFPKDRRLRLFSALLPQQGRGKEREHWDQQLRSQALA